jgi:uncharacterized membrane protein
MRFDPHAIYALKPRKAATLNTTRIPVIDQLRGLAVVAMITYHFTWDLEFFRYVDPGTATAGPMKWYARAIASTFLVLAGVSLVLAHGQAINWRTLGTRFARVAGAAALISLGTWFAMGERFIFFGILHQLAIGSLVGLVFLHLPVTVTLLAAAAMIAAPHYLRSAIFDAPVWWWLGLSSVDPPSNDYVPILPWTGMILVGIAAAKLAATKGAFSPSALTPEKISGPVSNWLSLAGRNSLIIYLVHQPMLIGSLYLFSLLSPAPAADPNLAYAASCKANCEVTRTAQFCKAFCPCVKARMEDAGLFDDLTDGKLDPQTDETILGSVDLCTAEAEQNGQ